MSAPNTFATATTAIPLANLDANFAYYDAAYQIAAGVMEVNYTFRLEDTTDPTKKAEFVMSAIATGTIRQYTLPNITGTLATLANTAQTFTGSISFVPTNNGAAITIGAIPQTGTITLGRSTATHTLDIDSGATASGNTKTVNFGTSGISGSITNITYGSSVVGATVTHTWNSAAQQMQFGANGLVINTGSFEVKTGPIIMYCPTPASYGAATTLTNADIQAQIINTTGATAFALTLPLGTTLETLVPWDAVDVGYDFYVINSATATITITANTGVTFVGRPTILTLVSTQLRIRRTAANTFIVYRIN